MKYAKITTDNDTIEKFLKSNGHWIVYALDSHVHWPVKNTIVEFDNRKLILFPETKKLMPAIAMKISDEPKITNEEGFSILNAFLSSMAWIEDAKINVLIINEGSIPLRAGKSDDIMRISNNFSLLKLPVLQDDISKLSLALYREALGLNGYIYQFLSFYRIIELNTGAIMRSSSLASKYCSLISCFSIPANISFMVFALSLGQI